MKNGVEYFLLFKNVCGFVICFNNCIALYALVVTTNSKHSNNKINFWSFSCFTRWAKLNGATPNF